MLARNILQSTIKASERRDAVFHLYNPEHRASFESIELQFGSTVHAVTPEAPALESQQMDMAVDERVNATLAERLNAIEQSMPPSFKADALNYFLIDPEGLDNSNMAEQQSLQSLVRAALYDPQRTIAAFIPVLSANAPSKSDQSDGFDSVLKINRHLTDFLSARGVTLITSAEALVEHVQEHVSMVEED